MTTKPNRPKATKLHSGIKPTPKSFSEDTSTSVFGKTQQTVVVQKQQNQTYTAKQQSGNKPHQKGTSKENDEAGQSKHSGLPKGFMSRKDAMARINAKESKAKLENDTAKAKPSKENNEVGQSKHSGLPKGFMSRKDAMARISARENKTKLKNDTAKAETSKENNEMGKSKHSGLPKGFMSRKDAMARINARESKTKLENDRAKAVSLSKNIPYSQTYLNHSEHKIIQEKNQPIPKTTEMSEIKTEYTSTRCFGNSSKDSLHEPKRPGNKTSPRTLEKSRTYRVPTRDAIDSIAHIKPEMDIVTKGDGATSKVLTRKQMHKGEEDKTVRRQSAITTGTSVKRVPSAKTSTSNRSSVVTKNEYLPPNTLKIMIMNASGKNDKSGAPAERRKHVIQTVICKESPDILLFQEFRWVGISGKTWEKYPIPEHFTYKGHTEASILYDRNVIEVKDFPATEIDTLLGGLQNNANNRLKKPFPLDFTPVPRMCITQVTSKKSKTINFIIISWHGRHNASGGGRMKEPRKIEYFEYLMEFLRQLKEKYKLPILIAGDFNIDMHSIGKCVQSPFKLCMYDASMRRTVNGIVDFYIVTEEIETNSIVWFDLERDTKVFHPSEILDHDPVSAIFRFASVAKGKSKFVNKDDWVSS